MSQLTGSSAMAVELNAARRTIAALREQLAIKAEELAGEVNTDAWKAVIKYAYVEGGDGARNIYNVTSEFIAMRSERDELREHLVQTSREREELRSQNAGLRIMTTDLGLMVNDATKSLEIERAAHLQTAKERGVLEWAANNLTNDITALRERNAELEASYRDKQPCGHPKNFLVGDEWGHFTCTVCERDRALSELAEAKEKLIFIDADLSTAILQSPEHSPYWFCRAADIQKDINEWLELYPPTPRAAIPENAPNTLASSEVERDVKSPVSGADQ